MLRLNADIVQVSFNGTKLPIKTFQDYVNLYPRLEGDAMPRMYERINDRWEVCIGASDGQFRQVRWRHFEVEAL